MRRPQPRGGGSALSRYLSDIREFPLLTKEQEILLGRLGRDGQQELVVANLGFVVKIASEYQNMGLPFEDLLNEGNIGLIQAASRYDSTKGIKFITYASWWVRKTILKALAEQGPMIRVPSYQRKKVARQRATREAACGPGHQAAAGGSCPRCAPDTALPLRYRPVSLDEATRGDGHPRLIELLVDFRSEDPERAIILRQNLDLLSRSLTGLNDKERAVITRRFGLSGSRVLTLKEIGSSLGLSRERVRQIEMAARNKLRASLHKGGPGLSTSRLGRSSSRRASACS